MVSTISQWTIDVQDLSLMAAFWSEAFGYRTEQLSDDEAKLVPPADAVQPALTVFLQVELGAKRADVGQTGDEPFVVLADPEGNEFCLLRG